MAEVQANITGWFHGSKAVDALGQPLRVYHGGPKGITRFEPVRGQRLVGFEDQSVQAEATFFSTGRIAVEQLKKTERVYEAVLQIKNPLDLRTGWPGEEEPMMVDGRYCGFRIRSAVADAVREIGFVPGKMEDWELLDMKGSRTLLEKLGYDGVILNERLGGRSITSYAVFRPEQVRLVDSPSIDEWFRGSIVVDTKGRPKILYHGGLRFDQFSEKPEAGAHYASDDIEAACSYAGQYRPEEAEIKPLWLSLKNPLDLRQPDNFEKWTGTKLDHSCSGLAGEMRHSWIGRSGSKIFEKIKAAGYDGLIFYDTFADNRGLHTSYAFFDPSQAKLAIESDTPSRWWDYAVRRDGHPSPCDGLAAASEVLERVPSGAMKAAAPTRPGISSPAT